MFTFQRYAGNPIFPALPGTWMESQTANPDLLLLGDVYHMYFRAQQGAFNEGAIWYPTVEKINGKYYLWYEGYGGGTARTEEYGSYLKGGKSQVGLALLEAPYFFIQP